MHRNLASKHSARVNIFLHISVNLHSTSSLRLETSRERVKIHSLVTAARSRLKTRKLGELASPLGSTRTKRAATLFFLSVVTVVARDRETHQPSDGFRVLSPLAETLGLIRYTWPNDTPAAILFTRDFEVVRVPPSCIHVGWCIFEKDISEGTIIKKKLRQRYLFFGEIFRPFYSIPFPLHAEKFSRVFREFFIREISREFGNSGTTLPSIVNNLYVAENIYIYISRGWTALRISIKIIYTYNTYSLSCFKFRIKLPHLY